MSAVKERENSRMIHRPKRDEREGRAEFYSAMHKIPRSVSLILYAHSLFCSSPRDINFRINVIHLSPQTVRAMQGPLCDVINADEHFDDSDESGF